MLIVASSRRRLDAPLEYPWQPVGFNTIPTYDGSGATIHPSVVDMVALTGDTWNGYRWWMANSPYPNKNDRLENPEVFGSNNGTVWQVPPGATNPIDPDPGAPWYHSDPELAYDPDGDRMVLYWRRHRNDTSTTEIHMATTTDGVAWTKHGATNVYGLSPSLVRVSAGDWRLFFHGSTVLMYSATSPLGPWGGSTQLSVGGVKLSGWHGDLALIDGQWYHAGSYAAAEAESWCVLSVNTGPTIAHWTTALILPWKAYRPTICDGRAPGTIDLWAGTYASVPGGCGTYSTTIPKSAWLDAIP